MILELIRELAAYEREPDAVEATEAAASQAALFGSAPVASCHVAELDGRGRRVRALVRHLLDVEGRRRVCGSRTCSSGRRRAARASARRCCRRWRGVCVERGYARFEWWVLDWNVDAQGFYRSLGARPEDDWTVWRVDGDHLAALGTALRP